MAKNIKDMPKHEIEALFKKLTIGDISCLLAQQVDEISREFILVRKRMKKDGRPFYTTDYEKDQEGYEAMMYLCRHATILAAMLIKMEPWAQEILRTVKPDMENVYDS